MSLHTMIHLHHVHLFSQDLTKAIAWYKRALGAEVCYDGDFGGSRNVFMKIGAGRIHLYSQAPRDNGRGAVHHIGIRTTDLASLHSRLIEMGVMFRSGVREFGTWRYIMCPALDDVLLELFEIDTASMPSELARYFGDDTSG
jgi:catechol 2,3-dioxygenase-like lactoylglutathione lyase family enzyme